MVPLVGWDPYLGRSAFWDRRLVLAAHRWPAVATATRSEQPSRNAGPAGNMLFVLFRDATLPPLLVLLVGLLIGWVLGAFWKRQA